MSGSVAGVSEFDKIEDTDNLNQKMQIRAVNEARSKVRQVRNRAQEQIASAGSRQSYAMSGGQRVYLQVVKSYALELAPLVAEHDEKLWQSKTLLSGEWTYRGRNEDKEIVDVHPEGVQLKINGLLEFLTTEFPAKAQFEVSFRDTAKGDAPETRVESWSPSFSQIDMIVLQLDQSRKSLGLFLEGLDEIPDESEEPFGG